MLIAILLVRRSSFGAFWIEYCKKNNVSHIVLDAYLNNIVDLCRPADIVMMDHHQGDPRDVLFAKQLLYSLEQSGKIVFPNFRTGWHFDDKLGQKFLFEALGIPSAKSWVFYDKKSAYRWMQSTSFPKIFKLRGGAGSANVMIAENIKQAKRLVDRAFGRGFPQYRGWDYVRDSFIQFRSRKKTLFSFLKSLARLVVPNEFTRMHPREKGYSYFQEFIPNEGFDFRVIVIGRRAFAIKRGVRKGDFRASGSGLIFYEKDLFSDELIRLSFDINDKIGSSCLALDFVEDRNTKSLYVVEISYGFSVGGYYECPGYWTYDLVWHEEKIDSMNWIIEDLIEKNIKMRLRSSLD